MRLPEPHRHNAVQCRVCGTTLDAATSPDPKAHARGPSNNTFSLCIGCGEVSVFVVADDGTLSLREATFVELAIFARDFGHYARVAAKIRARRRPNE